jgi:hypothetical protein
MKRSATILFICLCLLVNHPSGKSKDKDDKNLAAYLSGVTERGRALYDYDQAAWHGTDAFLALHPNTAGLAHSICTLTSSGWLVTFAKWNETHDRLFVAYEASDSGHPGQFAARVIAPPQEATSDLTAMERALELTISDFAHQNRPYNTAILPAPDDNYYVYIYPAQTVDTIWPLGGDVRYTVSADGKQIIEKRQLHKSILDMEIKPGFSAKAGFHTHILSDLPEDTDVFYVLSRKPSMPEYIGTQAGRTFVVNADGTIVLSKQ